MNVIYIGSMYPKGVQDELLKMGSVVDFSGHTFQTALLSGLNKCYPEMKVISSALTSTYPRVKKLNFEQFNFDHKGGNNKRDKYVGVQLADSIFTVCEAAQRTIGALRYAKKGHNDGVVYNTFPNIDYDAVESGKLRKELGISKDKIVVTSVGRVVKAKGHDYTIEAIKRISNPQFVFVVVGDGPYTEVYQEKCSEEIKEGRVHVLGSRSDVKEILKDSDIFIFTTLNENHSLALMEAVNMRCAAIATNVGGNPEIIQDNKTGILIPPRDNDAIVKALYKLQNPEMRMKYAQAAFDYCSSAFSIENTYGKLEKIFSEL